MENAVNNNISTQITQIKQIIADFFTCTVLYSINGIICVNPSNLRYLLVLCQAHVRAKKNIFHLCCDMAFCAATFAENF